MTQHGFWWVCGWVCLLTCTGCQQLQIAPHPIPVSLAPTAQQLQQKHQSPILPSCDELPPVKNRRPTPPCLPNKAPNKPATPLFLLQDWL
ncbi:MAG: hypothetical protein Q4A69_09455 [Moraxella sp.]|nr:hypothetical protein [Moraxella sp.]